jgi:phosphopantetheinyl transferase
VSVGDGVYELGPSEVHIWVVPLDDPEKRRRRELAHLAQREILAAYLKVAPETLVFERPPNGKPVLSDGALEFNLSHSGALALVAVSSATPVGVDVQGPHRTLSKPWFAERICTPRELAALGPRPDADQLLRLWVRKEAVIKARGEGSYVAVGDLDVWDDLVAGDWLCQDLPLAQHPEYRAAVAARSLSGLVVRPPRLFSSAADHRR